MQGRDAHAPCRRLPRLVIEQIEVPRTARNQRLDVFLSKAVPGLSLDRARALASTGRVRLKGKPIHPERRLWGGEVIELDRPAPEKPAAVAGTRLAVLYADADIVIVDKPAGIVVERDGGSASVVGILASQLDGLEVEGRAEPGVVHRLDRDTTGCLALARNDAAVTFLKKAFDEKKIDKRYWAIVEGRPPDSHSIETPYGRDPVDARRYTTRFPSPRRAALQFRTLERFSNAAWLDVKLETGRTHQIRVQLSEAGWPVIGDPTYGVPNARIVRQALHAHTLTVPRRAGGSPITVEAPLPSDMERLLQSLKGVS